MRTDRDLAVGARAEVVQQRPEPVVAAPTRGRPHREDPYGIVSRLLEAPPPGSYLAISHPTADFDGQAMGGAVAASKRSGITLPRDLGEVEAFFRGLDLVEPGVVPVSSWRPEIAPPPEPEHAGEPLNIYAGVGRKP